MEIKIEEVRKISPKCPYCGERFSLGRKIYHECENEKKFFGSLFYEKVSHDWNCKDASQEGKNVLT